MFEVKLSRKDLHGPVLEVGAVPNEMSLLNLPSLRNIKEKIGINLDGPFVYKDFTFHQCNSNKMIVFPDNYFGVVLCNSVLEHDKYFWKTLSEIFRVTKPGGLVTIGTPGYAENSFQKFKNRFRKQSWFKKIDSMKSLNFILSSTLTYEVHGASFGDFYRFSPSAYKEVFFREYERVEIFNVMQPPRVIGLGYKPGV